MKVLTVGVFDYFHYGHLKLLERCKQQGDYLIVAVQKEEEIKKTKPEAQIMYSTQQRMEMIGAIKFVDSVVEYGQVDEDIQKIDFDVFVIGEDQTHAGFQRAVEYCYTHGKKVVRLSRTPGICSSAIKKEKLG